MIKFEVELDIPIDNDLQDVVEAIRELEKREILVGFTGEGDERAEPGMSNAEIAFLNDQGSPAQNIPARPFMEPGVESVLPAITQHLEHAARGALEGDLGAVEQGFEAAGMTAQMGIKNTIVEGLQPALSPVTLMLRKSRGIAGTKPLIATGQLVNAVQYVVVRRK